jgi:hypothetical protein
MSNSGEQARVGQQRGDLPEFDLEYSFDEPYWPSEVTVYPAEGGAGLLTNWITVPIDMAWPLEECR